MKIEEVIEYAKEKGVSEKKIALLVAELHPDENGKLSVEESAQALCAINYHIESKDFVRWCLEQTKAMRSNRNKTEK